MDVLISLVFGLAHAEHAGQGRRYTDDGTEALEILQEFVSEHIPGLGGRAEGSAQHIAAIGYALHFNQFVGHQFTKHSLYSTLGQLSTGIYNL